MKKSILALTVLGAAASIGVHAQEVSMGGIIVANAQSYKIGNTVRNARTELRIDDFISRFWLSGKEDLGGGLSAIFYIENRFSVDASMPVATGNGLGNGETYVGLKGSWGQITLGKHAWMLAQGVPLEVLGAKGLTSMPPNMWGTYTILSQAGGYLDITRRNNSMTYRSPNINGFSGMAGIAASGGNGNEGDLSCTGTGSTAMISGNGLTPAGAISTTYSTTCPTLVTATARNLATYGDGRELFLQGQYFSGPLYAGVAYRNNKFEGRTGVDDAQWRWFGSYRFSGLKIGLAADHAMRDAVVAGNTTASVSRTAWMLPVSYVFDNNAILFNYARAGNLGGRAHTGAKMVSVGWDYAFSSRTSAGVYYSKLRNDSAGIYQSFLAGTSFNGSALVAGESVAIFSTGIKHTF